MLRRASPLLLLTAALAPAQQEVGSRACAGCHSTIYNTYIKTGMAQSAGAAGRGESMERAAFTHAGVRYRVTPTAGGYRMEFERDPGVKGAAQLAWFVGSGGLGRSYLLSIDGFLYQAPVSYYSSSASWQVSPGYESKHAVDLTRAVETGCLQCHASRLQPATGTQNRFATPPFQEGGVSCERCHGPGAEHVANRRAGRAGRDIVNPAKLATDARDSICAQCHLTGAARVARKAGAGAYSPGGLLSSSLAIFVWAGGARDLTATSHYERLHQSACKRASGARLWCGTCHDPHTASDRQSYRERCLTCHGGRGCTESEAARRQDQDDCIACHMPASGARMVEHVAFTDHGIVRRKQAPANAVGPRKLVPFWPGVDDRDLALGYAVAAMNEPAVRPTALKLLEAAAARDGSDVAILAQLSQFYDRMGRAAQAAALAERILKLDPAHLAAAVNLGSYRAQQGAMEEAVRLWLGALERNPALTGVRINVAVAQFRSGRRADAEASLQKALLYDPDSATARKLLAEIRASP
jgi:hypothetical protein